MLGSRKLAQRNAEMVGIVECVEQILVERMNILQSGKTLEDGTELFGKGFLGELDLSSIKACRRMVSSGKIQSIHTIESRTLKSTAGIWISPLILLILKPARIWVGNLR